MNMTIKAQPNIAPPITATPQKANRASLPIVRRPDGTLGAPPTDNSEMTPVAKLMALEDRVERQQEWVDSNMAKLPEAYRSGIEDQVDRHLDVAESQLFRGSYSQFSEKEIGRGMELEEQFATGFHAGRLRGAYAAENGVAPNAAETRYKNYPPDVRQNMNSFDQVISFSEKIGKDLIEIHRLEDAESNSTP